MPPYRTPVEYGPTARQRRLAAELRSLRERAGLTHEQAVGILGWGRTKLVKIELAKQRANVPDVSAILDAYGPDDAAARLALVEFARDVRQRGWWAAYGDVLGGSYAELEDAADEIVSWQVQLIPGLLQTDAYARTLIEGETSDPEEQGRRLQARLTRRALLHRAGGPEFTVILAEEILRRPVGGPLVMVEQLRALLTATQRPAVSIRVVPIARGHYPMIGYGSTVLFRFASAVELDTVYLETSAGGMYVEDVAQVKRCTVTLDRIATAALSGAATTDLITALIEEYQSHATEE